MAPRGAGINLTPFTGGGTTPPPSGTSTALISNWNGKCIDVNAANFSDGVPLQVWTCNGSIAQKWTFTGGTVRAENNKCMDVAGGSTAAGATVQIANC